MEKMTLQQAMELSEKKWKYIVDNNFSWGDYYDKIEEVMPELKDLPSNCPMCYYSLIQEHIGCGACVYHYVCGGPYASFIDGEGGIEVLEAIQKVNNIYGK